MSRSDRTKAGLPPKKRSAPAPRGKPAPVPPAKHVLVAALGQTPQVVTETLYELLVRRKIPISAVYVVTTSRGAEIAWRDLGGPQGAIARLCIEYAIDPTSVVFRPDHVIRIRAPKEDSTGGQSDAAATGGTLEDIRTSQDNMALASQLLGVVKKLTSDAGTVLYCSVAGGRKTMSAYMMLALTLYGREQDHLTHVLVSEEFESNRKFFYPSKKSQAIAVNRNGDWVVTHTRQARIELADIPYIRLRSLLGSDFPRLEKNVQELIRVAQTQVDLRSDPERLTIDLGRRQVSFGNNAIELGGIKLALFAYYAETKAAYCREKERPTCGECRACFERAADIDMKRFLRLYDSLAASAAGQDFVESSKSRGGQKSYRQKVVAKSAELRDQKVFESDKIMIHRRRINQAVGQLSPSLEVISERQYGNTRYGLALDKTRIEFIP